jgi:hypothetical protein
MSSINNRDKKIKTFLVDSKNHLDSAQSNNKENKLGFLEANLKSDSNKIIKEFQA